jgi:hypothetical protein
MRRALVLLLPLIFIAGCDEGGGLFLTPPGPGGTTAQLRVGFPPGGIVDTIVVEAVDRLPLRAADLFAPDGSRTPAGNIDVAASPGFSTGQRVAADPWRTSLPDDTGRSVLSPLHTGAGAAYQSRQQLLATVSTADIPLPDPVAYRRDWPRYRIRLTFGTPPGDVETRELSAPAPPPR